MALYALGDLHLSLNSNKSMEIFGDGWQDYVLRLKEAFSALRPEDVTVLCGDLSWGMSLEESLEDFRFIDALPGKKYLLKGNHDYWWNTAAKMERFFREHELTTMEILHNNCKFYGELALCGTRGWFYELDNQGTHDEKVLLREIGRLETSLKAAGEHEKLVFLHYPPTNIVEEESIFTRMAEEYGVEHVVYSHCHGESRYGDSIHGVHHGIRYHLVSGDYLNFKPEKILD
jgi:predicted phosphohydrolase